MSELSPDQIINASGIYVQTAEQEGVAFKQPQNQLPSPSYQQAQQVFGIETSANFFTVKGASLAQRRSKLATLVGLRVVVAAQDKKNRMAFLPSVLVNNAAGSPQFACLTSGQDIRSQESVQSPFSDLQQLLLGKLAAQHGKNLGSHSSGGTVNSGEIAHAVLVAASPNPGGIHQIVHALVEGQTFSQQTAQFSTIHTSLGERRSEEKVLTVSQVSGIIVMQAQQMPWPLDGDAFNLSAGLTKAAIDTRLDTKPDLAANLRGLLP